MSAEIAPGAADRAVTIVACLAEGRWEEARRDFNAKIGEALDDRRLADAWARMASLVGRTTRVSAGRSPAGWPMRTVIEVPLRCKAGEATGRVVFDEDGKVTGLWLRP